MTDPVHDLTQGWNGLAAEVLYACMEEGAPPEELSFYERHIRANGGAALDQACGTGRHLFRLLERGLDVHGADISADALRLARRAAQTHGVQLALYHQRMEECSIPHRYGTIYIANGTFQIITDRHVAIATLRRLWEHLLAGGQLLLELSIPPEVTHGPAYRDAEHPTRWEPIRLREAEGEVLTTLWTESVDLFEQTLVSKRRYEVRVRSGVTRSEVHAHPMTWFFHHEAVMMLERAGFEEITTYGDYTDSQADRNSTTVIYGARRPGPS
jgi:SAM-dependent methyltransferase